MATVKAVILKHQEKEDKTWNVKIRITHDRKVAYMPTPHYVEKRFINLKTFELKVNNNPVYDAVMVDVLRIRAEISRLGSLVGNFTAKGLCKHMEDMLMGNSTKEIYFFDFARSYFQEMIDSGRTIGKSHLSRINKFQSFAGKSVELFTDITSSLLDKYEAYLRKEEFSIVSIIDYIAVINNVFQAAKSRYNDEDTGIIKIPNNPFSKYKYPKKPISRKKALSSEQIMAIANYETKLKAVQVARDAFIISFLLCGMNSVDLYYAVENDGRVDYERRKTKGRRADNAFISIEIEPELIPYIKRYKDDERLFSFYRKHATYQYFNCSLNDNLKVIGKDLKIEGLTFYAARHSWATIARNDCGISMDDVAMALNHKSGHDVTDAYIKKDWSRIDEANRKVIDIVFHPEKKDEEKAGE
ncbi:phage integrase SAM-like domain-containing protein [uncultured Bacteroides sp.]|uniref:tyrosine-type recombinase/integrase n=1 Tax=uncultured Bacteroides sp. TaxID=162156 RepID=UPI0025ED58A2|nr:phage integrase SAM-like domain-containing protein [uncultured Bacteroides sp.]